MQYSVFIATSLDGYIARKDDSIDWLEEASAAGPAEDYGYADFIATVDCLVIGRRSFEKVISFEEWPYADLRVVVLSRGLQKLPDSVQGLAELHQGSLDELQDRLGSWACRRVYVDGGQTIQSFLKEGLITDLTITHIPILLGAGIPLFGEMEAEVNLEHSATKTFPDGLVQSTYLVK